MQMHPFLISQGIARRGSLCEVGNSRHQSKFHIMGLALGQISAGFRFCLLYNCTDNVLQV